MGRLPSQDVLGQLAGGRVVQLQQRAEEAIAAALLQVAEVIFEQRRRSARRRQAVIEANEELQARELIQLASLASAVADALRGCGVGDLAAALPAETGIAVFKIAFGRWVSETDGRTLSDLIQECLAELQFAAAGPRRSAAS
jgi:MftR C-terminal domain